MPDVFVSYSRRDNEFVERLTNDLRERGKDVWLDVEGIRDAEVFPQALRRAIESSDAFLFVISPDSVRSPFCEQEVAHASELNKRIVPLALRTVPDEAIPREIRFRNWIPVGEETDADRVISAIDTDLDWEQQHTRLTVKALEWDASGRDRSFLLRGSDLRAAEQWLAAGAGKDPGPTALEQEYLLAGRQAASRRQRTLVGGSLAVAAVAVGLLIFALISRGQAVSAETSAKSQALAAESEVQQAVDPERAVLLAMAAVRKEVSYGTTGTMFALRAAIDASPIRYRLPAVGTQTCDGPGLSYDPAPRSNILVEGLCNGELVFANATTGRAERTVRLPAASAVDLQYAASGSALIVAAGDRLLALDPLTGVVSRRSPIVAGFQALAVDPRSQVVAILAHDALDFWNLRTAQLTVTRPSQLVSIPGEITSFTYSPNGRELAITYSAGPNVNEPGLVLYDVAGRRITGSEPTQADAVAFSPNGRKLAVGESPDCCGTIVMLDAHTLKPVNGFTPVTEADVGVDAVAFSPDGSQLAYGFHDGTAGLISATTGQTVASYLGDSAAIDAVTFSPDGGLVATGSADGTTRAWRAGGLALRTLSASMTNGWMSSGPSGFVTLGNPGSEPGQGVVVQRWSPNGRPADRPLVLSANPDVDAAFLSADGQFAGEIPNPSGGALQGTLRIWNVTQRQLVRTVPLPMVPTEYEPVVSDDGTLVGMNVEPPATGPVTSYDLVLLDARTGRSRTLAQTTCSGGWTGFAFSPHNRWFSAGTFCGDHISVWNPVTGRSVGRTLTLSGGQLARIAFRPDGDSMAIAGWDGTIEVSPVPATGRVVTLTENTKGVPDVAYSPDGRYLASAGLDDTVRIFNARSLAELRVIAQPQPASQVGFTDGSREVVSANGSNQAWLWDSCTDCENPRALLALAGSQVTRPLTTQERAAFGVN
jgi:WD40 repeat protein